MSTVLPSPASGELATLRAALRGQYAIERELGRGGMGIVLLARDERLDRPVALKVLPPALADVRDTRERFLREARMAAQLSHPNIVPVHRADEIGGYAFFAMGYVEGETLADRLHDRGALPAAEVVRILREVAWALAYAHARGIVHRDVKPENILLERASGRAIVTDFGIARSDFNPSLTQDGYVLGTVHYMSPEQAAGDALDGRSDLYSLGCVGFLALSGQLPFQSESPQAILVAHATRPAPLLRTITPDVAAPLAAVIDQCLLKNPAERFATGEALADALGKALAAVDQQQREQAPGAVLSTDDARAVWRRASQLQAEAAARLESRFREAAETGSMPTAGRSTAAQAAQPGTHGGAAPTDAYRVRDVEAAAVEAGISQRFVAIALAELQSSPATIKLQTTLPVWQERLATRLLGTSQRTLSVSRTFRTAPRTVLQALGRTLQAPPFMLTLLDTIGGHPLDGGVLVFEVSAMEGEHYHWTWTRYGVYVKEVRVTLAPLPGDARSCEVTMSIDLRGGIAANLTGYAGGSVGVSAGGAAVGTSVAVKALGLAGVASLGPALVGASILGLGALFGAGPLYRWEMRKAADEMSRALAAIDVGIRSLDIFGDTPTGTNRWLP
jgi:hypothetical protein